MSQIDEKEIESKGDEIEHDINRTLERVLDDYSHKWKGLIGEAIQNSYDDFTRHTHSTYFRFVS
jgi:Mn-dependent DtxR family transcriptional regulator